MKTRPWSNITKKIAPARLARIQAKVDKEVKAIRAAETDIASRVFVSSLAALARRRLRGPDSLTRAPKQLIFLTATTSRRLVAVSKEVSKKVGFHVWPGQIAALLIEKGLGR